VKNGIGSVRQFRMAKWAGLGRLALLLSARERPSDPVCSAALAAGNALRKA